MTLCRPLIVLATMMTFTAPDLCAQTPPPVAPFESGNGQASLQRPPVSALIMGKLRVRLEQTTLDEVRRAAASGEIAHRGDAGDSTYWLCYTKVGAPVTERIWLISGEMGGSLHAVTQVSAQVLPDGGATAECPALPPALQPLSLDQHLWLGASQNNATAWLGAASSPNGAWRSYRYAGKVPGRCDPAGFDLLASLSLHFKDGQVNALFAGQTTSC